MTQALEETPHEPGLQVGIGAHVEVELIDEAGGRERLAFDLVPDNAADFAAGFLGAGTPLAKALVGHWAGTTVRYRAADIREVRILAVRPTRRTADAGAAAEREAVARAAARRSDMEDTVRFALTMNTKWGDYDPEGILPKDERTAADGSE